MGCYGRRAGTTGRVCLGGKGACREGKHNNSEESSHNSHFTPFASVFQGFLKKRSYNRWMETDTAIKGPVLQPLVAVPGAASEVIIVQCGAGEPASIIPCSAGDLVSAEISPRRDENPTDSGNVSPPLFPQAMSCTAAKRAGLACVLRGHPLGGRRDDRWCFVADAGGLEGGNSRRQGCGMAGVRGQQASLRDPGTAAAVASRAEGQAKRSCYSAWRRRSASGRPAAGWITRWWRRRSTWRAARAGERVGLMTN